MSSKISVTDIVNNHFSTYKDESGRIVISDWVVMVLFPLGVAIAGSIFNLAISSSAYASIVTAGAIFTGLLLNLLVLVYDQKTKLLDKNIKGDSPEFAKYAIRKRVIEEVHYNISYSIVLSLLLVVWAVVATLDISKTFSLPYFNYCFEVVVWFVNLPLVFLSLHLILTILMILKRVHRLISSH